MGEDLDKLEQGRITGGVYRLEIWSAIHPVVPEVFPAIIKPGRLDTKALRPAYPGRGKKRLGNRRSLPG